MARDLNKKRMRDSRIIIGIAFIISLLATPAIASHSPISDMMKIVGIMLLAICAIGRVYSTAFIGGIKNQKVVTSGPYSACRNPLYFYSLLGAAGIGLTSGYLTLFVFVTGGFILIYAGLIKREEEFLAQKFGPEYAAYCASTPRLIPNFKNYTSPEEVTVQTRFLSNAVWDAIWWFAAIPIFAFIQYLHESGILPSFFTLI